MPLKRVPLPNADSGNWGTLLNAHLAQTKNPANGAFNTFDQFSQRPTDLTADDEGKSFFYTQTGNLHVWKGSAWQVYDTNSVVNVKDYGAIGNGTTDDTTAIQNAVNLGKNTYFPSGNHKVEGNKGINLKSNCTYYGDGKNSILTMFENGATANQVTIFHCWNQTFTVTITNVVIKDLRMTGANPAGFVNAYTGAIDFYNAYNCLVENVNFDNFKSYGIYCYGDSSPYKVSNITIRKCHFDNWVTSTGAAFGAIQFGSKTEFCTAEDNTILCASAFGIASYDGYSGGVSIKHCFLNNRIENQITYGIIFYCTTPNTDTSQIVKGNRIKNIRGSITSGGVKGFGAGIYAVGQKNIMVCDNIVSDTGLDSDTKFASSNITVSRCYGKVIISGNICENGKFGGIELLGNNIDNAKGQFLITNNIVRNSSKDGIYVNEVTDLIVSGNNIYSENIATLSSMNLSTIDYVIITDNTITIISTNTNLYALQLDACKSINISNNFFRTTAVSVYNQIRNVDKGIVSGNMFESNNISKEPIFFEIVTNTRIMGNFVTCPSSVKMGFYGNCAGTFVDKSNRLINASAIINSASGVTIDY